MSGVAKAIRECSLIDPTGNNGNSGLKIAVLPGIYAWPSVGNNPLFVRTVHEVLWDTLKSFYQNHRDRKRGEVDEFQSILLKGQPGIGKTTSMDYLLMRALQENIPVIYETQTERWYFPPGEDNALVEGLLSSSSLESYRRKKDTLILHDHLPGKEPPITINGGFVFAPVSPTSVNYNHFIKFGCKVLWMPLPTLGEIIAMNATFQLEPDELHRRVARFNRVTRSIFRNQEVAESKLNFAIKSFDLREAALSADLADRPDKDGRWSVIVVDATNDLHVGDVMWVSAAALEAICATQSETSQEKLRLNLRDWLDNRNSHVPVGPLDYELWCANEVARGRVLHPHSALGAHMDPIQLSLSPGLHKLPMKKVKSFEWKTLSERNVIQYAAPANYPYFDFAAVIEGGKDNKKVAVGFQTTISPSHSSPPPLEERKLKNTRDDISAALKYCSTYRYVVLGPGPAADFKWTEKQKCQVEDGVSFEYARLDPREQGVYNRVPSGGEHESSYS